MEVDSQQPGTLDTLYGILFHPTRTMRHLLAGEPPLGLAAGVFIGVQLLGAISSYNFWSASGGGAFPFLPGAIVGFVLLQLLFALWVWFVFSATWQLVAELLGGNGSGRVLFALVGLAILPLAFQIPVVVAGFFLGEGWVTGLTIAIGIWVLILDVLAIREVHRFATLRAVVTLLAPLIFFMVAIVLLAAVIVMSWPFFSEFSNFPVR